MDFLSKKFKNEITTEDRYDENFSKAISLLIIEQQISFKAALKIKERFKSLVKNLRNEDFILLDIRSIQKIGVSKRKAEYIKNCYLFFLANNIDFASLKDKEVISLLCTIKGVGEWTAQMFLIFILKRKDVFSFKDIALINSIKKNYLLSDMKEIDLLQKSWAPYRTAASLLLWKSIEEKCFFSQKESLLFHENP